MGEIKIIMATEPATSYASNLIQEVNKIQVELCQSSKKLEINVETGRKKISNDCVTMIDRIRQSEKLALKVLGQVAKRRREEINKLNLEMLTYFKPELESLKQAIDSKEGSDCTE